MSFVERNKRWLLPLIGAGVGGVIWMNLPERTAPPTGAAAPAPSTMPTPRAPETGSAATVRETRPLSVAPTEPDPAIKALEAPPAAYDPAPLLLAGRLALTPAQRGPALPPRLHPERWASLCPLPGATSVSPAVRPTPQPLPPLNFIFTSSSGREAWMGGVGYRPGAVVREGYVLSRVNRTGVVLSGPSGPVEIPLKAGSVPTEPEKGKPSQP